MASLPFDSFGKPFKLTASDAKFDVRTFKVTRGTLKPTMPRLGTELAILINNLYKRRELDEVNVRSLVRIRVYLAILYKETNQKKIRARLDSAIRQITAELKHRFDFENRYNSGLIKVPASKTSVSTQTQGTGTSSVRAQAPSRSRPSFASAARKVQAVSRFKRAPSRSTRPVSAVSSPSFSGMSVSESVIATRGRRLAALIEKGYIKESQLTPDDARLLAAYRSNKTAVPSRGFAGSISVRPPVQAARPIRSAPVRSVRPSSRPVQKEMAMKSISKIPTPPPLPTSSKTPYRRASTTATTSRGSQNALRTDRVLSSVGKEIEKRRSAWGSYKDPQDRRDQMQGASDAEWEDS